MKKEERPIGPADNQAPEYVESEAAGSSTPGMVVTPEVIAAMRDGSDEAFKTIYLHYINSLYRFIKLLLGSSEDAEDIVQTTFIKLWEIRERLDPQKNIKSYLYTISRNSALDHLKAKRPSDCIDDIGYLADDTKADAELLGKETQFMVDVAIENMPRKRKEVFRMYLQGYTYQEISEKLDISQGNVRQYILRARTDISGLLGMIAFFLGEGILH